MSVFKRLRCQRCGAVSETGRESPRPPQCKKCQGEQLYSEKWYVKLTFGQKKFIKAVSTKKADAISYEADLLRKRDLGEIAVSAKPQSFCAAVEHFERWLQDRVADRRMSQSTADRYLQSVRTNLMPTFKIYSINQIRMLDVKEFVRARKQAGAKPATINRDVAALKRMFAALVDDGVIRSNPLLGLEMLPEENRRERFLSSAEIDRLLEACRPVEHLYLAVFIALQTGLRKEGVLTLRWDEIDFSSGVITKTVKRGKVVRIPLTQALAQALKRRRGIGYVIPSPKNPQKPMLVTSDFGFSEACRVAGIEDGLTFHMLRHTFATHWIMQFKDLHQLAAILGHSSTYITERYAHHCLDALKATMGQFKIGG